LLFSFFRHKIVAFRDTLTYNTFGGKIEIIFKLAIEKHLEIVYFATDGAEQ
jgi:hypothetical protein